MPTSGDWLTVTNEATGYSNAQIMGCPDPVACCVSCYWKRTWEHPRLDYPYGQTCYFCGQKIGELIWVSRAWADDLGEPSHAH